jgi:hypothetical protein
LLAGAGVGLLSGLGMGLWLCKELVHALHESLTDASADA